MSKALAGKLIIAALCASALLSGCSGGLEIDPRDLPTTEISGIWVSTATVGELGLLELQLSRRELSRVYDAVLLSQSGSGLGDSEGLGTLADGHLILDFGTGREDEYYFEGTVQANGSTITGIEGQFVFPAQSETLPIEFSYAGPIPGGAG